MTNVPPVPSVLEPLDAAVSHIVLPRVFENYPLFLLTQLATATVSARWTTFADRPMASVTA